MESIYIHFVKFWRNKETVESNSRTQKHTDMSFFALLHVLVGRLSLKCGGLISEIFAVQLTFKSWLNHSGRKIFIAVSWHLPLWLNPKLWNDSWESWAGCSANRLCECGGHYSSLNAETCNMHTCTLRLIFFAWCFYEDQQLKETNVALSFWQSVEQNPLAKKKLTIIPSCWHPLPVPAVVAIHLPDVKHISICGLPKTSICFWAETNCL